MLVPILISLYFIVVIPQLIFFRDGALWMGAANVWADWAAHLTYVNHFAQKPVSLWFSGNPIFAGEPLHYPFGVNFISAMLIRLGLPLPFSMWSVSLLAMLGTVWGAYLLYRAVTPERRVASLALVLLFLGGGLGYLVFLHDILSGKSLWDSLIIDYANSPQNGFVYGGHLNCQWLPQRAWQLGACIGVWYLYGLASDQLGKRSLLALGIATGLLPIVHLHTFIVVFGVSLAFALLQRQSAKDKLPLIVSFLATSLVSWLLFRRGSPTASFLGWTPGWLAKSFLDWPKMWLLAWGLFLPFAIAYLVPRYRQGKFWLLGSGLVIFLVANFVRFQPWEWDNTKLFIWSYLLLCPAVAAFLVSWFDRKGWQRAVSIVALASMIAGGTLEAVRLTQFSRGSFTAFSKTEVDWAEEAKRLVPPDAVVLASGAPHDWISALSGRQVAMGYNGWLWSYGVNYFERENDIRSIFKGEAEMDALLAKHKITHVLLDPKIKSLFNTDGKALEKLRVFHESGEMKIFAVDSHAPNR